MTRIDPTLVLCSALLLTACEPDPEVADTALERAPGEDSTVTVFAEEHVY